MTLSGWKWLLVPLALVVGSGWGALVARWKEPTASPKSTSVLAPDATPANPPPLIPRSPFAQGELPPMPRSPFAEGEPPQSSAPETGLEPDPEPQRPPMPADYFRLPVADPKDGPVPAPVKVGQTIAVEVLEALPGRPLNGERVVRPDGTITLGWYGDLRVAGLDRNQIKVRLLERMREYMNDDALGLIRQRVDTGEVQWVPPLECNRVFVDDAPKPTPPPQQTGADNAVVLERLDALLKRLDALEGEAKATRTAQPEPTPTPAPADAPK